jgi:hypothetical protein
MSSTPPDAILIVVVSDKKGGFSIARILITSEPGRVPSRLIERIGCELVYADDVERMRRSK